MSAPPETRLEIRYLPDGPVPWDMLVPDQLRCEVVVESQRKGLTIRGCYIDVGLIKTCLTGLAGLGPADQIGVPFSLIPPFGANGALPSVEVGLVSASSIALTACDWGVIVRAPTEIARAVLQLVRERAPPSETGLDTFTESVAERVLADAHNGRLEVRISQPRIEGRFPPSTLYESLLRTVRSIFAEDMRIRRRTRGEGSPWTDEELRLQELERKGLQEAFDAFASRFALPKATITEGETKESDSDD